MSGLYEDIYRAIREHQGPGTRNLRLLKLSEEVGEVTEAYIGYVGANARKGVTHTRNDIAKELADVVITAMVALHDWVPSPERFMKERLQVLTERIKEEGS